MKVLVIRYVYAVFCLVLRLFAIYGNETGWCLHTSFFCSLCQVCVSSLLTLSHSVILRSRCCQERREEKNRIGKRRRGEGEEEEGEGEEEGGGEKEEERRREVKEEERRGGGEGEGG